MPASSTRNVGGPAARTFGLVVFFLIAALAGCENAKPSAQSVAEPQPTGPPPSGERAPPRVSGIIQPGGSAEAARPRIVLGNTPKAPLLTGPSRSELSPGDIALNYVDADLRDVVRAILGETLGLSYTIDPAVRGTVTLQTAHPVGSEALLPLLESVLAENGAALVERDGVYQVVPAAKAPSQGFAPNQAGIGEATEVVQLRYASPKDLARVLQPYIGEGVRVMPSTAGNALVVTGSSSARLSLIALIRTFDVDFLAGQSYGIFPVKSDDPVKVADEVQRFAQGAIEGGAESTVRVVPLERINAVLVVARQAAYLDWIGRFIRQVNDVGEHTARQLHIYYVQNSLAADLARLLQRAFAPQAAAQAGAQPPSQLAPGAAPATVGAPAVTAGMPSATLIPQQPGVPYAPLGGLAHPTGGTTQGQMPIHAQVPGAEAEVQPEEPTPTTGIRIIPDKKNNALLIYATPQEYGLIEATLRKIDVLPLQVLVDVTVAEVTLNDNLQYGTQWFFRTGSAGFSLSAVTNGSISPVNPGFNFTFGSKDVRVALSALQAVTKVKVISAPELVVLDNETARLQVGDLVPIVTGSAVSVLTPNSPIVNSVDYRETGVILEVAPRVNSGGLVTLDIGQEVSDVTPTTTSTIDSPTFSQRKIKTRVVVQDGETIGLGGLIKDTATVSNNGFPWLSRIPIVGALFGQRGDKVDRTELIVLLTPHVIHDQRDVRDLTRELRERLGRLAAEPTYHDPIEPPGPLRTRPAE
jgi:general secretion pathway protein D